MTLPADVDFPEYPPLPEDRARQLLAFEHANPAPAGGAKDDGIRRELGLTPARYWQLLLRLAQTEQALRIDPVTTHRLRRLVVAADTARRARAAQNR